MSNTYQQTSTMYGVGPSRPLSILTNKQDSRHRDSHAKSSTSMKSTKHVNFLIPIGIVVVIVALALAAYVFKPFGLFVETIEVEPPSQFQVQAAFESSNIPAPQVSQYKYVSTDRLLMASIGQFSSSQVEYGVSNGRPTATSEGRGIAYYKNGYIDVSQNVAIQLNWNLDANEWNNGTAIEESVTVTPTDIANVDAINSDFMNILTTFDAKLAEMYKDADKICSPSLTAQGGDIAFTLSKTKDDGLKIKCVAETKVTWNDLNGWNVVVTTVTGDVATPEEEAAAEDAAVRAEANTPAGAPTVPVAEPVAPEEKPTPSKPSDPDYGGATMSLVCSSGEYVGIDGTVQFDSSGRILLKTDQRILVILDGHQYITDYFEISGSSFTNGTHTFFPGYISATGKLAQAPLLLNSN